MNATEDLRALERAAFQATVDDGLRDLLVAGVVMMFSVAPLLSGSLGDFWSSAIFLPVWAAIYLVTRLLRERCVVPRVGRVEFARDRKKRLQTLSVVLLVVNVLAFVLGAIAFLAFGRGIVQGAVHLAVLAGVVLVGASLAACLLQIPRVFLYGLLLAVAPLVGEWLFRQGYASHHGFPIVFGVAAGIIAAVGLRRFLTVLRLPVVAEAVDA